MKQLDAEINRDLLDSRYELLSSYDPFVQNFKKCEKPLPASKTSLCSLAAARKKTLSNC
jgi:hypothetical protein